MRRVSNRREFLGVASFGVLAANLHLARAGMPMKDAPASLEGLIPRLALLICRGRLRRQVFVEEEVSRKLAQGKYVSESDRKIFDIKTLEQGDAVNSFFEIDRVRPLFANPDALGMPAYLGVIYSYGFNLRNQIEELAPYVGKECIFAFSSLVGYQPDGTHEETFPMPIYRTIADGHWRESLPIDIGELDRVARIARQAKFVRPKKIVNFKRR